MAGKAKRDFVKGVYQLIYKRDGYGGLQFFDLVFTTSLTGNRTGSDRMNVDLELEHDMPLRRLSDAIKRHKITRAIWYGCGDEDYVTPKEVLKNGFNLLIMRGDLI